MARVCEICGKGTQVGNSVETRGKAKYLGGVGTKVTGITRRQFKPNLQRVKVTTANGTNRRRESVHSACAVVPCSGWCVSGHLIFPAPKRRRPSRESHAKRRRESLAAGSSSVESGGSGHDDAPTGADRLSTSSSLTSWTRTKSSRWRTRWICPTCLPTTSSLPSLDREQALANAPKRDEQCYRVPAVLGDD